MRKLLLLILALAPYSAMAQDKVFPLQNAKAYTNLDMNGYKLDNLDVSNLPLLFTTGSAILKGDGSGGINNVTVGSGLDYTAGVLSATSSGGSVTNVAASDLSPLFTTVVTNPTTTPSIAFGATDAPANSFFGNNTSSTAGPNYYQLAFTNISGTATNAQVPSTLSSKTLGSTNTVTLLTNGFTLQDNVDPTKQIIISGANIPNSITRTFNVAGGGNSTSVVADTGSANNFLTSISANGVVGKAQPSFSNISGTASAGQVPDLDSITAPSADVSLNSHKITSLSDPTNSGDAANKGYVDTAVSGGANPHPSVRVASTANVTKTGAQTVDGVALGTGGVRVLLKDQTAPAENGIWVTAVGAWTRAGDMDVGTEVPGSIFVSVGTVNANTGWATTTAQPITLDTDPVAFTQTGSNTQYSAGVGLSLTGTVFKALGAANRISVATAIDISAAYVGQTSLTTLGTISTGTWHADPIIGQYGGTGVNNGSNTLTLGSGSLFTAGSGSITLNASGATNLILPTTGILATLSGSEALTNKVLDNTNFAVFLDTGFSLQSAANPTSLVRINLSNLTATGTYNLNIPDSPSSTTVIPKPLAGNAYVNGISADGTVTRAVPAFTQLTGVASAVQSQVGVVTQAWDPDLDSLSAAAGTNTIYYRSATNTWTPVVVGSGLSFGGGTIATTGGGVGTITAVSGTLYVDPINGDDSTGTKGSNKPFLTLSGAIAHATSGDVIILGPIESAAYVENTGFTVPDGVTVQGMGRDRTLITSTLSDATHAVARWGVNSVIKGLTVQCTGANSAPFGIMSSDTAATGGVLIDVGAIGLIDGLKLDKTGTNSVTAYNFKATSGAAGGTIDCVNSQSGTNTVELWNVECSTTGNSSTFSSPRGVVATTGTVTVRGGKVSVASAGSSGDNIGLMASGGIVEAHNVTITRDGSGGGTVTDLNRTGGTLRIDNITDPTGTLTSSGAITNLRPAPASTELHTGNPTGIASTTAVMMGLGATITPTVQYHGLVLVTVSGTVFNASGVADGAAIHIRYGTGAAPANGDALTGTAASSTVKYVSSTTAGKVPFSSNAIITGLTIGTQIWIDLGLASITAGTANISDVDISAVEL